MSRGQKKTCRKKQHIRIDDRKERSDLICGKAAVGGNYNSTRDSQVRIVVSKLLDTVGYDYLGFHFSMDHFVCKVVGGDLVLKER